MVLFRVDSSPTIGAGHWMRCLTLARACPRAAFVSRDWLEPFREQAERHGIAVYRDWPEEKPAWVVLDGYTFTTEDQESITAPLLVVDDNRDYARYSARAILNQNVHATAELYSGVQAELLLGPRYYQLRPEFLAYAGRKPRPEVKTVLIALGGSDQPEVTARILAHLDEYEGLQLLLVGPPLALPSRHQARWLGFRQDLPELMDSADLAITGGAGTMMEALFMQLPTLAVCLAECQRPSWAHLTASGSVLPFDAPNLERALKDGLLRRALSQAGRELIDGHGPRRVAARLQ